MSRRRIKLQVEAMIGFYDVRGSPCIFEIGFVFVQWFLLLNFVLSNSFIVLHSQLVIDRLRQDGSVDIIRYTHTQFTSRFAFFCLSRVNCDGACRSLCSLCAISCCENYRNCCEQLRMLECLFTECNFRM